MQDILTYFLQNWSWESIFLYNKAAPLIFTRFYFWGFFAIVLFGYSFLAKKRVERSAFLFLVSLFFYYKSSGFFFFILIVSTLLDFFIGKGIHKAASDLKKKILLATSITVNLGMLVYFKYAYFFTATYNSIFDSKYQVINQLAQWSNEATGTHFEVSQILLPVGISFFTFQTISYTVDVYRNKVKPVKNLLDYGFYVSFFPQLVAGPIVRAADFIPQIYQKFQLTRKEFGLAVYMILQGLVKKIFIGDYIAVNFVDRVFSEPTLYSGIENLFALFGYSLQVYVDFSGYTDIAIGIALLMGFRLPKNFNSPYKARNVGDFWKRWHISLSSWLKDYLYIPMGGNRGGSIFTYIMVTIISAFVWLLTGSVWIGVVMLGVLIQCGILMKFFPGFKRVIDNNINLLVTMLLGGLWHGASWNFVLWGGLNGLGLIIFKFWKRISPYEKSNNRIVIVFQIALTFCFITFTRVFFRSEDMHIARSMLNRIGTAFDLSLLGEILISYKYVMLMMLFGFTTHWLPNKWKDFVKQGFVKSPIWLQAIIVVVVVFIVYQSVSAEMQPFIYFQF